MKNKIIVICGPTASGKSELALHLAKELGAEIVSADSLQVYKYLDIGSAKPSILERKEVTHHLIDILFPDEPFSAKDFQKRADTAIEEIRKRGRIPIICGGTGLYIKALLHGMFEISEDKRAKETVKMRMLLYGREDLYKELLFFDPDYASKISKNDPQRIERALSVYRSTLLPFSQLQKLHNFKENRYNAFVVGIDIDKEILHRRIDERVYKMIKDGFVYEVERILSMGYNHQLKPLKSIGYKEIISYIMGNINLDEAIYRIKLETKRYAKRQITWFRGMKGIKWYKYPLDLKELKDKILKFLEG